MGPEESRPFTFMQPLEQRFAAKAPASLRGPGNFLPLEKTVLTFVQGL